MRHEHLELWDTGIAIEVYLCHAGGVGCYLAGPFVDRGEAIEYCDRMHADKEVWYKFSD